MSEFRPASSDSYSSLGDGPEVELKEKGSRFLGQAWAVRDEEESAARLQSIRKRHHTATHHCWAHRLGEPGAARERADDDGEPSGTAGAPILQSIDGAGVHGALVVVTRWFGGTKLGTGGLVRAYGDAAREALAAAPRRTVWREAIVTVTVEYADVGAVEAVVAREGAAIRACERSFAGTPEFRIRTLASRAPSLSALVRESTAGRARIDTSEVPRG
ncbi:MAG: YigZ family protein [bacterium]